MITLGAALLAIGCFCSSQAFAQAATAVTTTNGAFTEYVPGSETMVVRSKAGTSPLRYSVTKQTTIVDETGAPVAIDRISARQSALNPAHGFRRPAGSVASCCAAGGNGDYSGDKRPCRDWTANQYHHDNNPSSHT